MNSTIFTIVALGDSITQAVHVQPEHRWPSLLENKLSDSLCRPVKVVNAGIGGNTSREGLARMEQDVLAYEPDIVLVEFGGNDAAPNGERHVPLEEFVENLAEISRRVQAINAKVILLTIPFCIDEWIRAAQTQYYLERGGSDAVAEVYRQATRDFAASHALPLTDTDIATRTAGSQGDGSNYYLRDGEHLTEEGNRIFFECVFEGLKNCLETH
jgi:lysophospholipase L1-like esterase